MCKKHHTAEQVRARAANKPLRPLPFSFGYQMVGVDDAPPCITRLSFLGHRLIARYLGMSTLDSEKSNGMLYRPSGFSCAFENSWNEVPAFPRFLRVGETVSGEDDLECSGKLRTARVCLNHQS